ncbi:monocarboxylate transporter 10-like isoform X2 [Ylistrum balloti]|uniref:monocarboxylate transporter 10-like isoform X2 n=1 Tax=Ylistrum balloti TaxID=509963 RepID=UPI002905C979|nr:monocarboxylate transporter 10-like isoform X2 [Ylistrum balloti]
MSDHMDVQKPLNAHGNGMENGSHHAAKKNSSQTMGGEFVHPDGGWGWVVCFTSMLTNGTVFGVINTFGIIYVVMLDEYADGDPNISLKTSFVGSVCTGVTFLMCIVSSILSDRIGIRPIAVIGAVLGMTGLIISAFVTELEILYLSYGVCLGIGAAFSYSPSLVILGHYFKKHMGLVNGMVAFGSALFTIALSLGLPKMLEALKIRYTFLVLAGCYFILILGALTWKPLIKKDNLAAMALSTESVYEHCNDCCTWTRKFLNVRIFRNKAYVVWCLSLGVALIGYFVPFVHLVKHTRDRFPGTDGNLLITFLQITSGIGRLVFGKVADFPFVNRIYLQQASFLIMGVVTVCIPLSGSYGGLVAISLIFGLCDGIFVCLLGPIAFDIVGHREASQAIGFLLGIFAVPFVVGPPTAGVIYDTMHSYDLAFYIAGGTPILGSLLMFLIPKVKQNYPGATEAENFASISMLDLRERVSPRDIERYSSACTKTGPSTTELQIVNADDIVFKNGHIIADDIDVTLKVEKFERTTSYTSEEANLLSDDRADVNENKSYIKSNLQNNDNKVDPRTGDRSSDFNDGEEVASTHDETLDINTCEQSYEADTLLKEVNECLNERQSTISEV